MSVKWAVKSEKVHSSIATWEGPRDRDGGKALLNEAFDFVHEHKQAGRMTIDFGIGGSISSLRYEQRERTDTPARELSIDEVEEIVKGNGNI